MRMTATASLAANSSSGNVLSGKLGEYLRGPSQVTLLATGSAVGLNVTFLIGDRVLIQDQAISLANRFPLYPDDIASVDGGFQAEKVTVDVRNTTAGALTYWIVVDVDQVA